MSVLVVGISHRTSPVAIREKLAFPESAIPGCLAEIKAKGVAEEAVILSTCNRVELYAGSDQRPEEALRVLRSYLVENRGYPGELKEELYCHSEPQSLEHLFRVASGLDSMLLGETEILGQLKKAYDLALQHQGTGRSLNKAFQRAFNVAKQIRTETNIQRGSVSVASAAVELAERIFESLKDHDVLVIGAGDTSEKTARALLSRGAKEVWVTNRSLEKAAALAESLGGKCIPFDDWSREFPHIDIVISSTSAPHYVLDRTKLQPLMRLRHQRPLLLIDIAVPRDIDPEVNVLDSVYLYNIDDLQMLADDAMRQRKEEIARCNAIIAEKVRGLLSRPVQSAQAESPSGFGPMCDPNPSNP